MKKIIFVSVLAIAYILILSACNTYERCPAYTDLQIEATHNNNV